MCGIVGYVGHREAQPLLVEGLSRLEYRGYDSAGVSLIDDAGIRSVRSVGNLRRIAGMRSPPPRPCRHWSDAGIAHTRWATHGDVTAANAHPHTSCDGSVHIVLNGIVENYEQLRDELVRARLHGSRSETDAEVVAHLLGCRFAGVDLPAAVRLTCRSAAGPLRLHGDPRRRSPDARRRRGADCPMVIGCADGEAFVASAIAALPAEMTEVAFIGDDEIVTVRAGELTITTRAGVPVSRTSRDRRTRRGDRRARRLQLVHAQGDRRAARRAAADRRRPRGPKPGVRRRGCRASSPQVSRITITGCGTSHNAAMVGSLLLQRWAGIPTTTAIASEWCSSAPLLDPGELVIGVTQSGETRDTVAALRLARELGAPTIALTNAALSQATAGGRRGAAHARRARGRRGCHQDVHEPGGRVRAARAPPGARERGPDPRPSSTRSRPSCAGCRGSSPRRSPTSPSRSPRPRRPVTPTASSSCTSAATWPTRWRARGHSR